MDPRPSSCWVNAEHAVGRTMARPPPAQRVRIDPRLHGERERVLRAEDQEPSDELALEELARRAGLRQRRQLVERERGDRV